ncbi:MAG TPA: methyltransferase domain-containing protein [Verrucomicrobiae bacterium]|nr:methyltransferase domain-containing protein [Verrucomicrobiae bacterium]
MIRRRTKAAYFGLMRWPMWLSGLVYKHFRAPRNGTATVKVHLGPGQAHYLDGWINVDANLVSAKIDVWADLRNRLPFHDGTVDAFYSHHVIEHLPDSNLTSHLEDLFRCLKPGGIIRIGGPNGDAAAKKLVEGDAAWFSDFPDKRESVGGRFANFLLCRGEHLTILTFSYLQELASQIGFVDIHQCRPITDTAYPLLIDNQLLSSEYENTPEAPHTLLVEAKKP